MEAKVSVLMQKYELGKMLGQGTFAKVYHARNLETGMSVAIKVIDKEKILKVGMVDQIQREILVMKLVRHPNIVELYEVMASKKKIYFVMEYIKGGELFNKVTRGKLKEEAARKYFKHLINGVDFCHSRSVYHRDLKPENLLIDEYGNLKISDFGLSTFVELKHDDGLLHTTCGTPAYVAPEVINRRGYDGAKSDIWSCGVILFVLLCGYLPFHDPNLMEMYRKINNSEFKFPNWVAPDARRLISKMLDPNPSTRISTSKIMESSWFRRGSQSKAMKTDENEFMESLVDGAEGKGKPGKPTNLNAFDIIALSTGFDLSGLFESNNEKKDFKFTSNQPANTIFSKLEELAKSLKLKVTKKNGGLVKLEGSKEGRKGLLSIEAEIFEFSSEFHLVELKKSNGDTLEYQKIMEEEIRPSLKDVVWSWQGDDPRSQQNVSQLAAK